jgi:UDP-N-acetyl-D-mannosaminuronic acid dehydrogenase
MNKPTIVMVGLGYIGLPTGAVIASTGIPVHGVDVKESVIETINQGHIHIVEPGLEDLVKKAVQSKMLSAHKDPIKADIFIIAVPTPFKGNHVPDISFVQEAAEKILPYLEPDNLVIIESTSPVGTTQIIKKQIESKRPELNNKLHYAYCPERVLPGKIIEELKSNSRVIGGVTPIAASKAKEFYSLFVEGELFTTTDKTAEMCKLVENSFRDVNIAFANELSTICDEIDVNVMELIQMANKHPRVNILTPGCGVGGHCIAIDPWFLVSQFPHKAKLIEQARRTNDNKPLWVLNKIEEQIKKWKETNKGEPSIACLGLAFKPNIDDLRESPALLIARELHSRHTNVKSVEPNVKQHEVDSIPIISLEQAKKEANIIIILVAHKSFKKCKYSTNAVVMDFTNVCRE